MVFFSRCMVAAVFAIIGLVALGAGDRVLAEEVTPETGTVFGQLYDGLKLVEKGDFNGWVEGYCSKTAYCSSANAIKSVTRYNLPAAKRQAAQCFKGAGKDKLEVTRVNGDPATSDAVKIFLQCAEDSTPRSYEMIKEGGKWLFKKI